MDLRADGGGFYSTIQRARFNSIQPPKRCRSSASADGKSSVRLCLKKKKKNSDLKISPIRPTSCLNSPRFDSSDRMTMVPRSFISGSSRVRQNVPETLMMIPLKLGGKPLDQTTTVIPKNQRVFPSAKANSDRRLLRRPNSSIGSLTGMKQVPIRGREPGCTVPSATKPARSMSATLQNSHARMQRELSGPRYADLFQVPCSRSNPKSNAFSVWLENWLLQGTRQGDKRDNLSRRSSISPEDVEVSLPIDCSRATGDVVRDNPKRSASHNMRPDPVQTKFRPPTRDQVTSTRVEYRDSMVSPIDIPLISIHPANNGMELPIFDSERSEHESSLEGSSVALAPNLYEQNGFVVPEEKSHASLLSSYIEVESTFGLASEDVPSLAKRYATLSSGRGQKFEPTYISRSSSALKLGDASELMSPVQESVFALDEDKCCDQIFEKHMVLHNAALQENVD